MTDINCANLIDLSLEDDIPSTNIQNKTECDAMQPSEATKDSPLFIPPVWRKRDSLDNNPFDYVQKLADRVDDPFDIVEKEACLKAQQALKLGTEIKLGRLLSLSNENLLDEQMPETPALMADEFGKFKTQELDQESPPVMLNDKQPPDSVSGSDTDNSSAESTASAKLKKNMEYRKRLLKLSIANAAFSSPATSKTSFEFEHVLGTPVSSMLSRAAEFGENLLSAESPLKLIDDEDIMSVEPPNFIDAEKNFEADLEMLKIPILNELPSPAIEETSISAITNLPNVPITESFDKALPSLEAIKAKLKAKKDEINNNQQQEISSLIRNLKSLITCGKMVDENKKQKASNLLESLNLALKPVDAEETLKSSDLLAVPPQPIQRQGTFDLDLQGNDENNFDNQPLVQDMPNCMISSSATYDGETTEEKQDLNLPEIAPPSPLVSPSKYNYDDHNNQNHLQSDVNDIVEQLSKLLINHSNDNATNNPNPTFIVVMNTNQLNHSNINSSHQTIVDAKQKSSLVASYLENSINDGSPDLTKVNPVGRRRSQSLSIHDKVKIVQLPMQPPTPRSMQKHQHDHMDESPPVTTTSPLDKNTPEFKTPSRMVRRNSYSSGTPHTAQIGARRTGYSYDNKMSTYMRRAQTLDTHHEGQQQQAIVRPMPMPSNNLPTFKPDLKKKIKHNTESIIKSSGPLKATIPVKKVAPMLKTPPTPDHSNIRSSTLHNTSLHSKITQRMPTTPLPAKGTSVMLDAVSGYPNACSTPAANFTSPLKRTTGPVNKPRYSYMSVTPNPKSSSTSSISSANLKRRTITEFKAKSPLKTRVSSVGLAAAAAAVSTVSKTSIGSSRLSISAGARISKTPVKTTTANTATVKPTSRLGSRMSLGGSTLSTRNKENKRP